MAHQQEVIVIDIAHSDIAEIRTNLVKKHRSLYARKKFRPNQLIVEFNWTEIHATPTYLTVQVGENEHIELFPEYLECINHSCDPNSFFDTSSKRLVALKAIAPGEEITFFYPSTEWDMDQIFKCHCNCSNCLGIIKGAKYLDKAAVRKYRFTDFINQKLKSREV
jgi:hypothetical protein